MMHTVRESSAINIRAGYLMAEVVCPICRQENMLLHIDGPVSPVKPIDVCGHLRTHFIDDEGCSAYEFGDFKDNSAADLAKRNGLTSEHDTHVLDRFTVGKVEYLLRVCWVEFTGHAYLEFVTSDGLVVEGPFYTLSDSTKDEFIEQLANH